MQYATSSIYGYIKLTLGNAFTDTRSKGVTDRDMPDCSKEGGEKDDRGLPPFNSSQETLALKKAREAPALQKSIYATLALKNNNMQCYTRCLSFYSFFMIKSIYVYNKGFIFIFVCTTFCEGQFKSKIYIYI